MKNAANIENLLAEAMPFFDDLRREVAALHDGEQALATGTRIILNEDGTYDTIRNQQFYVAKGTDIASRTSSVTAFCNDLAARHGFQTVEPGFYAPSRHNPSYSPAMEIATLSQGVAIVMGKDIVIAFDPLTMLPAQESTKWKRDDKVCIDHAKGPDYGFMEWFRPEDRHGNSQKDEEGNLNGSFYVDGHRHVGFKAEPVNDRYRIHKPVHVAREKIGKGYLTRFLEILETPNE